MGVSKTLDVEQAGRAEDDRHPSSASGAGEPSGIARGDLGPGRLQGPPRRWVDGFDYLRVIFMVSVILTHSGYVVGLAAARAAEIGRGPDCWDFFYYQVQSCAVPVFVLISMILFVSKAPTRDRLISRLKKLGYLYAFWVGAWVMYTKTLPSPDLLSIVEFLLMGGGWVFYFLAVLILCTPLAWLASRLSVRGRLVGLGISSALVVATFSILVYLNFWTFKSFYWLPTCFFPLPFAAALIAPHVDKLRANRILRLQWIIGLVIVSVAFALLEWQFSTPSELIDSGRRWIPKHARLSIQFGGAAFVMAGLAIKRHPQRVMSFLSRNSLGIYCLHPFVLGSFLKASSHYVSPGLPSLAIPVAAASTILFCGMAAEFLRRAFQNRLV